MPDQYRLTLKEKDEPFFKEYIQTDGKIDQLAKIDPVLCKNESQKNIKENAALFLKKLETRSKQEIELLARYILNQCCMVVVSTPDSDSAYRIFAVLNDRGLELSHADILKSEIIGRISKDRQQDYAALWESTEDRLGKDAFSDLFSHIRMIKRKAKMRMDILKEFREYVIEPNGDPMKVIDEIVEYGDIYHDIKNASFESSKGAEEINAKLSWLNHIDNADWLPPAIFYVSMHKDPGELIRFFTYLERLAVGLMILRADINERLRRYGRILDAIEKGQDLYDKSYIDSHPSILQLNSEERSKIVERLNGDLYEWPQFRLYVLLRLNESLLESGMRFDIDYHKVTIEHVLPQTLPIGSKWETCFPGDLHKKYVHKLGNLALQTRRKAAEARNHEFEVKKKDYTKDKFGIDPFPLTINVLNEDAWTPEIIDKRQGKLLNKIKDIWSL